MRQEEYILKSVLWPKEKYNLLGNLSYADSIDFKTITSIDVSRTDQTIEIFYCNAPIENLEDKTFFVKLYMKKEDSGYIVDFKKSSPELKTEKDIEDTLNIVKNAIIKINAKPIFFPTGNIKSDKLTYKV